MKPAIIGLVVASTIAQAGSSWGQITSSEISTRYSIQINGRMSTGENVLPVNFLETDVDNETSSIGKSDSGGIDLGSATIRASAFGFKGGEGPAAGGGTEMKPPSLGVQVAGSSQLTRPPLSPITGQPGETGAIEAAANARAEMKEMLTFETPGINEVIRVSGYFRLSGRVQAHAFATGDGIAAVGQSSVVLTSNVFPTQSLEYLTTSITNPDAPILGLVVYSFTASPGVPKLVQYSIEAGGRASIGGVSFALPGAAIATADFDSSFEHTFSWGGITSVTNASTGEPIADWKVTSASGFDYSLTFPLPEPSSQLLALVGIGLCRRKRRSGP